MTPEEIDAELEEIYCNTDSLKHKAYFASDHVLHEKVVNRVEELSRLKMGDGLYNPEVMPVTKNINDFLPRKLPA